MWCKEGENMKTNIEGKRGIMNGVLKEEYNRLEKMEKFYYEEIVKLPKGSLLKRTISNRPYYYLKLRDENTGEVKSLYVKASEVPQISKRINERRRLTQLLRQIRADKEVLRKVLKEDE